jgi:hypothetical protein
MRSLIRDNAASIVVTAATLLVMAWLGLYGWAWTDWDAEARPAVDALITGHVSQFLTLAPIYGGSLMLRAPFMLLTKLWHGGELAIYRAGAAPCLAATGVLGVWLCARMRAAGRSTGSRAVALMLCVANPLTLAALETGHPEELLGAVLCIAAVLCAMDDRPIWAAVLLGLAIPNKEWAVLAIGPTLVALPRARFRALLLTGLVAGTLLAPLVFAPQIVGSSGGSLAPSAATALDAGAIFQPWQIWWFLGAHGHIVRGLNLNVKVGYRIPPGWIESVGHPLIVAIMVPLSALYAVARRRRSYQVPNAPLLLLVLLLALRCVLDPWDTSYYALPCLLALVTWESLSFNRVPVVALGAALVAWFVLQRTATLGFSADMQALIFAFVSIPSVLVLGVTVYAPELMRRLVVRPHGNATGPTADWPYAATQKAGVGT